MTPEENQALSTYWHKSYIDAARACYPDVCGDLELSVGFKLTSPTGRTYRGYYWPLVDRDHGAPVLHESTDWEDGNWGSCPDRLGDGLCVAQSVVFAQSGGLSFGSAVGHVLVYATSLARTDSMDKYRLPWVIDVDCFTAVGLVKAGCLSGADLTRADLTRANLTEANLTGANLTRANLTRADLTGANLTGANLYGANLTEADLTGDNLTRANLTEANLTRADLTGANLTGANLYGANLTRAYLSEANLTRANLYGAVGYRR